MTEKQEKTEQTLVPWFQAGNSDLWVSADRWSWRVGRKRPQAAATGGKVEDITYHGSLVQACQELLDRKAKGLPIATIKDAAEAYKTAQEWLRKLLPDVEELVARAGITK